MQHILIVEDDTIQCTILKNAIQDAYPGWCIDSATCYDDAIELLETSLKTKNHYHLFLLDIQLASLPGDRSGFFLARRLRKEAVYFKSPILFLTAVSDEERYALSEFHCYNYIPKPYTNKEILFQISQMLLTGYLEQTLLIPDIKRLFHRIDTTKICYVEALSHKICIHTVYDSILTREYTLSSLSTLLGNQLIRCHKSYLINPHFVISHTKNFCTLSPDGKQIPIGRNYQSDIERILP